MLALLFALLAAVPHAGAPQRWGDNLQPTTYASPSGDWQLLVDPSDRPGNGPCRVTARRQEQQVWSAEFVTTFRRAVVDDEGYLAGYAYTRGSGADSQGELVVSLVSPAGKLIASLATLRRPSQHPDGDPNPSALDLFLDDDQSAVVIRVNDEQDPEVWWVFDMRTGERRAAFTLPEDMGHVWAARAVPGRPFYVTYGYEGRYDVEPTAYDIRLHLIGPGGELLASRTHERELDHEESEWHELWDRATAAGLFDLGEGRFSAWLPRSGLRVDYTTYRTPSGDGWVLEEVARSPYTPPEPAKPAIPEASEVELQPCGEMRIGQADAAPGLLRGIWAFGFDELGRLLVFGDTEQGGRIGTALVVTPEGEVVLERRIELPQNPDAYRYRWWPFESGRWLVSTSWTDDDYEEHGQAWWVDPATGELDLLEALPLTSLQDVASTGDGGFVAVSSWVQNSTGMQAVGAFDQDGNARWLHDGWSVSAGPHRWLESDGVAVTADGQVVTIGSVTGRLQLFGMDGAWVRMIDLEQVWDEPPNYPTAVRGLPHGGFLVVDFGVEDPIRVLDADGAVQRASEARLEDGTKLRFGGHVAPDGRLWASDGDSLLRLGPDGTADLRLGAAPDPDALGEIDAAFVDRRGGRILVRDKRSHAVHVFGVDGSPLCIGRPEVGDFEGWQDSFACADDGRFFARTQAHREGWIAFDGRGERLGPVDLGASEVVFLQGERRWCSRSQRLELLADATTTLAAIERKPDGTWLSVRAFDVAADGSLAVLDGATVSLYAPDGAPLSDHRLPAGASAYRLVHAGDWVIVSGFEAPVLLFEVASHRWLRFGPSWLVEAESLEIAASPDGRELWVLDPKTRWLRRLALPRSAN